jgi:hypothetical protein
MEKVAEIHSCLMLLLPLVFAAILWVMGYSFITCVVGGIVLGGISWFLLACVLVAFIPGLGRQ